ncbi:MAG: DUF4190 domain-containing protein [Nanoarchaeota archaeon]
MAIASLVLGVVGFFLWWFPFVGRISAILGVVFGIIGIINTGKGADGRGMAIAGLVLGAIGMLIPFLLFLILGTIFLSVDPVHFLPPVCEFGSGVVCIDPGYQDG